MQYRERRLFCFGIGYCALALIKVLQNLGWRVAGTCRSEEDAALLSAKGIDTFIFDGRAPISPLPQALAEANHVLCSVPPKNGEDVVLANHGCDLAQNSQLEWVGYLSTTGVYGDCGGEWVDESSQLNTVNERGRHRIKAEKKWLQLRKNSGVPVHIFRLAGIYGPGRNAIETVRAGRARRIFKRGQVFSRIHVDDISQALAASIARPNSGRIYNICDNEAAPPQEVITYACDLLGIEPPPLLPIEGANLSPMARSFYSENKRVSNQRMTKELGVQLKWPNYKVGLKGILEL